MKKILFTLFLAAALTGARGQIYIDSYKFAAPTNTVLLLNGNGAHNDTIITDGSDNNLTLTRYGVVTDTTVKKYGSASLKFDGVDDYLEINIADTAYFTLGKSGEPFTIEFWFYLNSASGASVFFGRSGGNGTWNNTDGYQFLCFYDLDQSPDVVYFQFDLSAAASPGNLSTMTRSGNLTNATWYHYAVTFDGTTTRLFIDGTEGASTTDLISYDHQTGIIRIGALVTTSPQLYFQGYLDDFRVTKGTARYTSNFTAPTAELTK